MKTHYWFILKINLQSNEIENLYNACQYGENILEVTINKRYTSQIKLFKEESDFYLNIYEQIGKKDSLELDARYIPAVNEDGLRDTVEQWIRKLASPKHVRVKSLIALTDAYNLTPYTGMDIFHYHKKNARGYLTNDFIYRWRLNGLIVNKDTIQFRRAYKLSLSGLNRLQVEIYSRHDTTTLIKTINAELEKGKSDYVFIVHVNGKSKSKPYAPQGEVGFTSKCEVALKKGDRIRVQLYKNNNTNGTRTLVQGCDWQFRSIVQSNRDSFYLEVDDNFNGFFNDILTVTKPDIIKESDNISLYLNFNVRSPTYAGGASNFATPRILDSTIMKVTQTWITYTQTKLGNSKDTSVLRLYNLFAGTNVKCPVNIKVQRSTPSGGSHSLGNSSGGWGKTPNYEYLNVEVRKPANAADTIIQDVAFTLVRPLTEDEKTCFLSDSLKLRNSELTNFTAELYVGPYRDSLRNIINKTGSLSAGDRAMVGRAKRPVLPAEWPEYIALGGISNITINYDDVIAASKVNVVDEIKAPKDIFKETIIHEMAHIGYKNLYTFQFLRWSVLRDKARFIPYKMGDKLGKNMPIGTTDGCSEGSGHESYNPENKYVCDMEKKFIFMRYLLVATILFYTVNLMGQWREDPAAHHNSNYVPRYSPQFFNDTLGVYRAYYTFNAYDEEFTLLIRDTLSNLVHREALRFKQTLHPVFQTKDTVARLDSLWPGWRTRNPLCIMAPQLCDCTYAPLYTVCRVRMRDQDAQFMRYYRHFYRIRKRDRFVRTLPNGVNDTLYEDVSSRFFPFDSLYTGFCVPKTGTWYLTGGNVFSDTIPPLHLGYFNEQYYTKYRTSYWECIKEMMEIKTDVFDPTFAFIVPRIDKEAENPHFGRYWFVMGRYDLHEQMLKALNYDTRVIAISTPANAPGSSITFHGFQGRLPEVTLTYINRPTNAKQVLAYGIHQSMDWERMDFLKKNWSEFYHYIQYYKKEEFGLATQDQIKYMVYLLKKHIFKKINVTITEGTWGESQE